MKKKFFAILLCLTMLLGLATTAAAAGTSSITVSNPAVGDTYNLYKIFDATYSEVKDEKGNTIANNIAYTIKNTSEWYQDVVDSGLFDLTATADDDATATEHTYVVTVKDGVTGKDIGEALGKKLAGKTVTDSKVVAAGTTTISFTGLDYGYYLIANGNTAKSVVTLDSTTPNATVVDKNESTPKWPKDPEDGKNANVKSASVGDTVTFTIKADTTNYAKTTVDGKEVIKQIEKYVITDTPDDAYTLDESSVSAKLQVPTANTDEDGNVIYEDVANGALTVTTSKDGKTYNFEIVWADKNADGTYTSRYQSPARIVLTYNATVNAAIKPVNKNEANFKYYFVGETTPEEPDNPRTELVYSYTIDLNKITEVKKTEDGEEVVEKKPLTGAEFKLYADEDLTNEIKLVKDGNDYRVATAEEADDVVNVIEAGHVNIKGLAAGTYYLVETKAPAGYNKLKDAIVVEIREQNETVDPSLMDEDAIAEIEVTPVGAEVINNAGVELPATGGIGTTIFYVVGGVLVVAAGVLLVVKKRTAK